jgi:hypothetical protein
MRFYWLAIFFMGFQGLALSRDWGIQFGYGLNLANIQQGYNRQLFSSNTNLILDVKRKIAKDLDLTLLNRFESVGYHFVLVPQLDPNSAVGLRYSVLSHFLGSRYNFDEGEMRFFVGLGFGARLIFPEAIGMSGFGESSTSSQVEWDTQFLKAKSHVIGAGLLELGGEYKFSSSWSVFGNFSIMADIGKFGPLSTMEIRNAYETRKLRPNPQKINFYLYTGMSYSF